MKLENNCLSRSALAFQQIFQCCPLCSGAVVGQNELKNTFHPNNISVLKHVAASVARIPYTFSFDKLKPTVQLGCRQHLPDSSIDIVAFFCFVRQRFLGVRRCWPGYGGHDQLVFLDSLCKCNLLCDNQHCSIHLRHLFRASGIILCNKVSCAAAFVLARGQDLCRLFLNFLLFGLFTCVFITKQLNNRDFAVTKESFILQRHLLLFFLQILVCLLQVVTLLCQRNVLLSVNSRFEVGDELLFDHSYVGDTRQIVEVAFHCIVASAFVLRFCNLLLFHGRVYGF
mmetsp:Transcript_30634/g.42686  ORF Transcript_30634/g.42686 Transcript_30634/m.42686 type:complete len:284 (-) Transcript_30634:411-1262(-)